MVARVQVMLRRLLRARGQVWGLLRARAVSVQVVAWDRAMVRRGALGSARSLSLTEGGNGSKGWPPEMVARRLQLVAPDVASLTRLLQEFSHRAQQGQLRGQVLAVQVQVAQMPAHLRAGLLGGLTQAGTRHVQWWVRRDGRCQVQVRWAGWQPVALALAVVDQAVVRQWRNPQVWTAHAAGVSDEPPPAAVQEPQHSTVVTTVAYPCGRVLAGAPARYLLRCGPQGHLDLVAAQSGMDSPPVLRFHPSRAPEAVIAAAARAGGGSLAGGPNAWKPYSVVQDQTQAQASDAEQFCAAVQAALQACGAVITDEDPGELDELGCLQWAGRSVASSREALIAADRHLRTPELMPAVTVVIASKRPDDLDRVLLEMAAQTYPQFEVLVGAHGWQPDDAQRQRWQGLLPGRLRLQHLANEVPFGHVLGQLSRRADTELITKVDDDDRYGRHHLIDLVAALRCSGADLVSKSSRFTYLAGADLTLDRQPLVSERWQSTPAGGTLMLPRSTLVAVGGWGRGVRHVDTDLVQRLDAAGGSRYRCAGFGYVYVRRDDSGAATGSAHTWQADLRQLKAQANRQYAGLPQVILQS